MHKIGFPAAIFVPLLAVLGAAPASAIPIGGVEFPQGAASFADTVISYSVGGGGVTDPHQGSSNALNVPDYAGINSCPSQAGCSFVTLGDGGSIVLQFTNNLLTGSGDNGLDLWIFEVGPDIEDTFVEISMNGSTWFDVGKVVGATAGIDIDAFGWGASDEFGYIRLTDDTDEDGQSGATAGADIDAVGAISTRVVSTVPEPGTIGLIGLGLVGLLSSRRRRRA